MRLALAVLLLLHGVAHLPGVVNSWRLATLAEMPYHTTLLAGRLDVGDAGMRLMGALWLAAAVGCWAAGAGALLHREWWPGLALAVALLSLLLSVAEWPAARIGVAVNVAIVAALLAAQLGGARGAALLAR